MSRFAFLVPLVWSLWLVYGVRADRAILFSGYELRIVELGGGFGTVVISNRWNCVRSLSSASWRIELLRHDQGKVTERLVSGSDGDMVATVSTPIPVQSGVTNLADIGILESGYLPPESKMELHPLWAAFCLPSVVKHIRITKLPLLSGFGDAETNLIRNIKFTFNSQLSEDSTFNTQFSHWNDGVGWTTDQGQLSFHKAPPPLDKGYLAAQLQRIANATTDDVHRLMYSVNTAYLSNSTPVIEQVYRWDLFFQIVGITNCTSFIPSPTTATEVEDRRWADAPLPVWALRYREKGGRDHWRQVADPSLLTIYNGALGKEAARHAGTTTRKRFVIITVMTSIAALLLFRLSRK